MKDILHKLKEDCYGSSLFLRNIIRFFVVYVIIVIKMGLLYQIGRCEREMRYFARFFENLQQDLKAFGYWCLVLTVFRMAFIWVYSSQLNGNYADVPMALLLGFRLSMKTAGMLCLIGFVLAFYQLGKCCAFNIQSLE